VRATGDAGLGTLFDLIDPRKRAVRKEWGEHDSLSVQKVTRWESEPFDFIPE
jgi:hypothetical protein